MSTSVHYQFCYYSHNDNCFCSDFSRAFALAPCLQVSIGSQGESQSLGVSYFRSFPSVCVCVTYVSYSYLRRSRVYSHATWKLHGLKLSLVENEWFLPKGLRSMAFFHFSFTRLFLSPSALHFHLRPRLTIAKTEPPSNENLARKSAVNFKLHKGNHPVPY